MSYANSISRIQESMNNVNANKIDNIQTLQDAYAQKLAKFDTKESGESSKAATRGEIGANILTGIIGVEGYKSGKKLIGKGKEVVEGIKTKGTNIVNKFSDTKNALQDIGEQGKQKVSSLLEDGKDYISQQARDFVEKIKPPTIPKPTALDQGAFQTQTDNIERSMQ